MSRKQTHKDTLEYVVPNTRGLTKMQEKFCQLYCTRDDLSQTECARQAGFAESHVASIASRLLNGREYPLVVARIQEIQQQLAVKYEVTFENHVRKLAEIRDLALGDKQYAAAISAEKSRGQAAGLYIDRKEILTGKIDQMSRAEVEAEIAKLFVQYPELAAVAPAMIELQPQDVIDVEEAGAAAMGSLESSDEGEGGLDED
jgi:phage terminase small subunit